MIARLHAILKVAKSVGMTVGLTSLANEAYNTSPVELRAEPFPHHYHVEICPTRPGGLDLILKWRQEMLEAFADIDIGDVWIWPRDQGGCKCSDCKPWGGVNLQPARLQKVWDTCRHWLSGGFPYSEGIFEDLNKAVCLQLYWDPDRPVEDIVREYAAGEFAAETAENVVSVTFVQEDPEFNDSVDFPCVVHKILYLMKREATMTFSVNYLGPTSENARYYINGFGGGALLREGPTYTRTIQASIGSAYESAGGIDASVVWSEREMINGELTTVWHSQSAQFETSVEFWKPLRVIIQNPYGAGTKRRILSQTVTPAIVPTTSDMVEGRISGEVQIKALADGVEFVGGHRAYTSFAGVKSAENTFRIGEFGENLGAIVPGMSLNEGEHVQIGTTLGAGSLTVRFCNGEEVWLQAEFGQGFGAVIGGGGVQEGSYLLNLYLRNQLQEFKDMPRRALRMRLYKELGSLLDDGLGVPGFVGIATETPGGALERFLARWGEPSYLSEPPADELSFPPLSFSPLSSFSPSVSFAAPLVEATSTATNAVPMNDVVRADFTFNTDGTIYLENMGGNLQLQKENTDAVNLSAGAALMVIPARGSQTNSLLSKTATSTTAWEAPAPPAWTFSPTNGAILNTRTPAFSIDTASAVGIVIETVQLFLDDTRVTDWFDVQAAGITGRVLDTQPLDIGTHTLTLRCTTLKGTRKEQSISFEIAGEPPSPEFLATTAFSNGVWLSWQALPGPYTYAVWRTATTNGTKALLSSTPRQQPGFLDETPLPINSYWIETRDGDGVGGLQLTPITCVWSKGQALGRS